MEKLEIARLEREEREATEQLNEERRRERLAMKKLQDQGVIHGKDYEAYTITDIENIHNYDFLEKLRANILNRPQPSCTLEEDYYNELCRVVNEQVDKVLIEEME